MRFGPKHNFKELLEAAERRSSFSDKTSTNIFHSSFG